VPLLFGEDLEGLELGVIHSQQPHFEAFSEHRIFAMSKRSQDRVRRDDFSDEDEFMALKDNSEFVDHLQKHLVQVLMLSRVEHLNDPRMGHNIPDITQKIIGELFHGLVSPQLFLNLLHHLLILNHSDDLLVLLYQSFCNIFLSAEA
jgi:hypothetical protein